MVVISHQLIMLDVHLLNVNHVELSVINPKVKLLEPRLIVRVFVLFEDNAHPKDAVILLNDSDPLVTVIVPLLVTLSCIVHHHHTPLNVIHTNVVQLNVIVFHVDVLLNVGIHVYVLIRPEYSVILHETVIDVLPVHVTFPLAGAANVISLQSFVVASIVTVYAVALDAESKKTSSVAVGKFPAHGAPPDVVAQWFVASDQFHVPHTQYNAIFYN